MTQAVAPVVGARVTTWVRERWALDFSVAGTRPHVTRHGLLAEVPSGMLINGSQSTDTSGGATITTGSARVMIGLTPRPSRVSWYVAAGVALVGHSGAAYRQVVGNTGWGPVLGTGGRFQVTRAVAVSAELNDYIYSFSGTATTGPPTYSLGVVAGNYQSQLQHDLFLSLGVSAAP